MDLVFLVWREDPATLQRLHEATARALPEGWAETALLVENGAAPETSRAARAALVRHHPMARRRVLRLARNRGFAAAIDLALDDLAGRHALLLNPDGRPGPGMVERLAAVLDDRRRALWAAPAVHGPGEEDHPAGPPYAEDELPGTALMLRREPFLALGGFDPLFRLYHEDFDASRRIRAAGHELLRVPEVRFDHVKDGRSARGIARRELWYALSWSAFVHRHEDTHVRAAARVARSRARSLPAQLRDGNWPAAAGIAAATAAWPVMAVLAERRRRRPWDGTALDAWLRRHRAEVQRSDI